MNTSSAKFFVLMTFLAALLLAPPLAASDTALATEVTLLIGHPGHDAGSHQGVLIVPGAVIPVRSDSRIDVDQSSDGNTSPAHRVLRRAHNRISQVARDLVKSLRLSNVSISYRVPLPLEVGEPRDLAPPSSHSDVRLSITLLGFNAAMASYEVKFFDGSMPLTDTSLTVHRGQQAVVGGLNGADAPYLFLVIAPAESKPTANDVPTGPVNVDADIQPPLPIEKTPPTYTSAAKQAHIEGIVIVQAIIENDGTVSDVEVLKGLSHGLSEAAVEAIEQWRFEPALLDGEPVAVYYNLTINFRLPADKEDDTKS